MLGKSARGSAPLTRLLPQGFDALFAAGTGLTSRNGGNRHPALSTKNAGKGSAYEGLASSDYDKNTNKSQKKSEAILNGRRLPVLTFWLQTEVLNLGVFLFKT